MPVLDGFWPAYRFLCSRTSPGLMKYGGIQQRWIEGALRSPAVGYQARGFLNARVLGIATKVQDKDGAKGIGEKGGFWKRLRGLGGFTKVDGVVLRGLWQGDDDGKEKDSGGKVVGLNRLFEMASSEKRLMSLALSAQLVSSLATMAFPMALGMIVDQVQAAGSQESFIQMTIGLGGIFTVSAAAVAVRVAALEVAGSRISRELRKDLFASILRQETAFFDTRQSGELVNRLAADASSVSKSVTENIAKLLRSSIVSGTSLGCILYLSPSLSLVALSLFPPIFLCAGIFRVFLRRLSQRLQDSLAAATQVASERLGSIRIVRLHGAEPYEHKRYSSEIDKSYDLSKRVALAEASSSSLFFYTAQLSLLAVLYTGGNMVSSGALSIGSLTSFCMYAVNLGVGSSSAATAFASLARAQGAAARIMGVLDRVPTDRSSTMPFNARIYGRPWDKSGVEVTQRNVSPPLISLDDKYRLPAVEFNNVHFSYPTRSDSPALNGLNLSVWPGEIVAVCGKSGSGKSTLINALLRMYLYSGDIKLGGVPIQSIPLSTLREEIAVVPQEPTLFDGTISENIGYGHSAVDQAAIERAAADADAHATILNFPSGYSTRVGERGVSLSGGERGRVAIARALLRKPRVLVMDEATAAMDAESELKVAEAVAKTVKRDRIAVIAIAHRISMLKRADRIAVVNRGIVEELGEFDDLLARRGSLLGSIVKAAESNSKNSAAEEIMQSQ